MNGKRVKKVISILLAAMLMMGGLSTAVSADEPDYQVRILGELSDVKYGEQDTYTVAFQIKTANGKKILKAQELSLSFDMNLFEIVNMAATMKLPDTVYSDTSWSDNVGSFATAYPEWTRKLMVMKTSDNSRGFIRMEPARESEFMIFDGLELPDFASIQTIRLAFKPGKSFTDMTEESIQFMSIEELDLTNCSFQVCVFDGLTGYFYGARTGVQDILPKPLWDFELPIIPEPITGVILPVAGEAPSTAIDDGTNFTSVLSWDGNPSVFAYNTAYTATITLTADKGYLLTGLDNNSVIAGFSVNGIAPSFVSNSGTVLVFNTSFPVTTVVPPPSVSISISPSTTVIAGDNVVFTANTTSNSAPTLTKSFNYQWYKGGALITGATNATLTYNPVAVGDAGEYACTVTETVGDQTSAPTTSSPVTLTVNPAPITAAAITVTAPAQGAVPNTTATGTGNFTVGAVTWTPAHNPFQGATQYTATVILTANSGHTFTGLTTATINGQNATVTNNTGAVVTLSYQFPATGAAPITVAAITVTAPVQGAVPDTTATGTGNFTIGAVTWMPAHNPFQGATQYTATVTLTANSGHTFTGLATATINGQNATVTNNTGAVVTLSYQFPATGAAPITVVEITVTAPIQGAVPNTTATGTGNFTIGAVTWTPTHNPFQGATQYTATVTLTANSGHTFTGLATASINDQNATVTNNTGAAVTLLYQFPATGVAPITAAAITVTAPAQGTVPNTTATGTGNFTIGAVTWTPAHNPFQGVTRYTAAVTLTANSGYTFTGLTTATINSQNATVINNTGATVTLSYQFPETEPIPITSAAITVTAPVPRAVPNTTATGNGNFTIGAVSWTPAHNPFQGATQYTATVTLTADVGYTFTGLTTATINELNATITNNTGTSVTLTLMFPDTGLISITTAAITVTAPAQGTEPNTVATGTGDFSIGPVVWTPNHNPFQAAIPYTATVTLTANSGYTFMGLNTATINDQIATVTNTGTAATVSYQFPAEKAELGGIVTILGTAKFDQQLSADTTGLTPNPADVDIGTLSFQWKRGEINVGTNSPIYTLIEADIGHTLTVTVTAANCTGEVTSDETDTVEKADGSPAPAIAGSYTDDGMTFTYTIASILDAEYRIDDDNWQESNVFSGIIPLSTHTFSARLKATATHKEGTPGHIGVEFVKLDGREAPPLEYTMSGEFPNKIVAITVVTGAEYRFNNEPYSPTENTFRSASAEDVTLYVRLAETATHNASPASSTTINTDNLSQDAPPAFTLTYVSVDDTSYTVTIPLSAGAEYSFDGETWDDINIKTGCLPGQTITGYKRMAAHPGYNASSATDDSVALPLFQVKTPTSTPNGGSFSTTQDVALNCDTEDATIYYTLDGTTPTANSLLYIEAFTLTSTTTVRVIAIKSGMIDSAVLSVTFTRSSGGGNSNPRPTPTVIDPIITPLIEWGSFTAFINGYPDKTFRGQNSMTREEFVNIIFKIKNPDELPEADIDNPSFSDVLPGRWSYNAVEWAKGTGITETDSGYFRPSEPITRVEVAAMLVKLEEWTEVAENIFIDIEEHPNYDDILKAVQAGIFIGYPDNTFRPDEGIIRYELVTAMVRYLLGDEPEDSMWRDVVLPFTDVPYDHWAYKYVAMATAGYEAYMEERV